MHKIVQPDGWKEPKGYANGVLAQGATLYIGGQIGWNEDQVFVAKDFVGQMEQALKNIAAVLDAAGGKPEHLTRLTWYVTDKQEYLAKQREVGRAYRDVLGKNFPAMTMVVVSALVEDEALLEIEATAVIPN
ncbi:MULTISPECIES: RidA family protein [Thalassospira]|jgi:enamine deaminase RidA (YjgF/YER057c/UK114 family)|uniref:RidA family protein n=1 Tax=Thalassospira povalilytica TaxID=732237 RepID=A0A8I1M734_9PROT|nr:MULTISPECIES: RidA family protein [Thalassospira]MEE3046377.1 RidA family protein [Pseudomonadota bacterium]KZB63296.1 enamine deaminase RidA [Thalassospira sp. MCCC 1A02491]MAL38952.1 RidA family protein [Thalassospira sp.]MBN8196412.1 RidA family protein [Thalassospira povalilytica]MBO6773149.1 RidA family protein [Thalassospira sp.]|tara:strand:+ start:1375 stop:1770 length:396 start_codon:yes stop_codon:yes gene_type:complete